MSSPTGTYFRRGRARPCLRWRVVYPFPKLAQNGHLIERVLPQKQGTITEDLR